MPLPVVVAPPGLAVTVHVPDDGNPLRATLPVGTPHMGWVMAPTEGIPNWATVKLTSVKPERGSVASSSVAVNLTISLPYQLLKGRVMLATRFVMLTIKAELPLYVHMIAASGVSHQSHDYPG